MIIKFPKLWAREVKALAPIPAVPISQLTGENMSLKSVLDHVGQIALTVLHFGEVGIVMASPVIDAELGPGIGSAVTNGVISVMKMEQAAKAAGQDKAGAAKLAAVEQSVAAGLPALEAQFHLTVPTEKQAAYAQLLYNLTTMFEKVPATP